MQSELTATLSQASSEMTSSAGALRNYHRIVLLTEGFTTPFYAKTAMSLLRYRIDDVIAVLDGSVVGQDLYPLLGIRTAVPIVGSLDGLNADSLFLGTSVTGGKLPEGWRSLILNAIQRGLDVVSGNHEFLNDDPDFRKAAQVSGSKLIDVRHNVERSTSTGQPLRQDCLRVHTVGQDCSLGKMVVSLEIQRELVARGLDAAFVATGQTGIMVSGDGVPVDCVVSDFVNGAVEALVRRLEHHDILLIEGQGSISHPSFSAVTMGLLHGCQPSALIYCYEVGRQRVKGLDQVALLDHRRMIDAYESIAALRHPTRVIGIGMNSRSVSPDEAEAERQRMQAEFELPVCDVYRDGPVVLADAVLQFQQEQPR